MSKSTYVSVSVRNPVNTTFPKNHFKQIKWGTFFKNLFSKLCRNRIHFEESPQTTFTLLNVNTVFGLSFCKLCNFGTWTRHQGKVSTVLLHRKVEEHGSYWPWCWAFSQFNFVTSVQGGVMETVVHWSPTPRSVATLCTTEKGKHYQLHYDTPLILGHASVSGMLKWEK